MAGQLAAVTGVGYSERFNTIIKKSIAGLVREAALNALKDAGIEVDSVVGTHAHIKAGLSGNKAYLETKIKHGSHMLDIKKIKKP